MVDTTLAQQPTQFSNVQLEMLKLFAKNVPDADYLKFAASSFVTWPKKPVIGLIQFGKKNN